MMRMRVMPMAAYGPPSMFHGWRAGLLVHDDGTVAGGLGKPLDQEQLSALEHGPLTWISNAPPGCPPGPSGGRWCEDFPERLSFGSGRAEPCGERNHAAAEIAEEYERFG